MHFKSYPIKTDLGTSILGPEIKVKSIWLKYHAYLFGFVLFPNGYYPI